MELLNMSGNFTVITLDSRRMTGMAAVFGAKKEIPD